MRIMRKYIPFLFFISVFVLNGCQGERVEQKEVITTTPSTATPVPTKDQQQKEEVMDTDDETVAVQFVKDLLALDIDVLKSSYYYDDTMKKSMNGITMEATMKQSVNAMGTIEEVKEPYVVEVDNYKIVNVPVKAEISSNISISFDEDHRIAGFYFQEYAEKAANLQKTMPEGVTEVELSLVNGQYTLPGKLTLPQGEEPCPVVILVHGSGANDMDETVFNNKPFRDIAWDLAANGIATYRYDKRTYVYGTELQEDTTLTLQEETILDAVAAVTLMGKQDRINPSRIYVLGHSLGGYAIPLIAQETKDIAAGYVIMAGVADNIKDIIVKQYEYIANVDGEVTKEEKDEIDKVKAQVKKLSNLSSLPEDELVLGAYKAYWKFLSGYDPIKEAAVITKPVLLLQGEKDYQVTTKQYEKWKTAFAGKGNWTMKTYSQLNHLMMINEGEVGPAAYEVAGNVDNHVIMDIVEWINQ